jgi:hypothetical protein
MHQTQVAAAAFDERADGGLPEAPDDEVAFPVSDTPTLTHDGGAVIDQPGWGDETNSAFAGLAATPAQRPPGPQPSGQCPVQATFAAVVNGLVDGFVTQMPGPPIG